MIAEMFSDFGFDLFQAFLNLLPHSFGKIFVVIEKGVAGFGGDNQTRRHRQAGARHFAQACALSSQQRFVVSTTLFKKVDPFMSALFSHGHSPRGKSSSGMLA